MNQWISPTNTLPPPKTSNMMKMPNSSKQTIDPMKKQKYDEDNDCMSWATTRTTMTQPIQQHQQQQKTKQEVGDCHRSRGPCVWLCC